MLRHRLKGKYGNCADICSFKRNLDYVNIYALWLTHSLTRQKEYVTAVVQLLNQNKYIYKKRLDNLGWVEKPLLRICNNGNSKAFSTST